MSAIDKVNRIVDLMNEIQDIMQDLDSNHNFEILSLGVRWSGEKDIHVFREIDFKAVLPEYDLITAEDQLDKLVTEIDGVSIIVYKDEMEETA